MLHPVATLLALLISIAFSLAATTTMADALVPPTNNGNSKRIQIRAILFDMDGTLLDTETLSDQAIVQVFPASKLPREIVDANSIPWELKVQLLGKRGSEWIPIVQQYAKTEWKLSEEDIPSLQECWQAWEENLNNLSAHVKACPGAVELVKACASQTIPMAIATSSRQAGVDKKRQNHNDSIFKYMQAVVAGDDPAVKMGKPAPDIYIEAARRLGVSPENCLVFEDAAAGCQSGKAAGCQVVAIPDARFTAQEKTELFGPNADVILDSLESFDGTPFGLNVKLGVAAEKELVLT